MADTAANDENETAKKAPAKKSAAKKSTARKATTKKSAAPRASAARKSSPRKSAAPKASSDGSSGPAVTGARLAYVGAEQLVQLTQKHFEGIVGLDRVDDGWTVQVEVLELRRIPETTDVIGVYEVRLDTSGELVGYKRLHRYLRGEAGEER